MWKTLIALGLALAGCADNVQLPTTEQLTEFHGTGSAGPAVDLTRVTRARLDTGPYLVRPGEVLELTMPVVLQIVTSEAPEPSREITPCLCRVSETGTITLPAIGEIPVAGKSTAQIEAAVAAAYFPRFTTTRPSVYARILEHKTHRVSIVGAVKEPGLYDLRADKMSLVALIMEAKGITEDGAAIIRISHAEAPAWAGASGGDPAAVSLGTIYDRGPVSSPAWIGEGRPASSFEPPAGTSAAPIQVRFDWTGPLCTCGALVVARGDTALTRTWLDIGVPRQRQDCLHEVRRELSGAEAAELEAELSKLAQWLNSRPHPWQTHPRIPDSGWQTSDGIHLATVLDRQTAGAGPGRAPARITSPAVIPALVKGPALPPASDPHTLLLPVRGLNIPFVDLALREGDAVVVEPLVVSCVSVLGLVNHPGNFEYPPGVQYNLGQVIALAGGLNTVADPRYVTVYRLKSEGSIVHATFQIQGGRHNSQLTEALSVPVKPGDIVAVEQTPRTRSNQFLDRVFRINIGTYVSMEQLWD
jgi:protein involved in polysaccharide export with SLBB domain